MIQARETPGLSFFDHMLDQLSKHSLVDIDLNVVGDLDVDEHHTIEDTRISYWSRFNVQEKLIASRNINCLRGFFILILSLKNKKINLFY